MHKIKNTVLAPLLIISLLASCGFARKIKFPEGEKVEDGLTYYRYEVTKSGKELVAHILHADLMEKRISVRSFKADGEETLQTMVTRVNESGEKVLGAINGDFFFPGTEAGMPNGVQVSDGRLVSGPRERSMIAFRHDNKPFIGIVSMQGSVVIGETTTQLPINGVNLVKGEFKKPKGILLYTPEFYEVNSSRYSTLAVVLDKMEPALQVGDVCKGRVHQVQLGAKGLDVPDGGCILFFLGEYAHKYKAKIKEGTLVTLKLNLPPIPGGVMQAIGGGPRIVRDGKVSVEIRKEEFTRDRSRYLNRQRHPRSAVGYDKERKNLFLVMIEGRHEGSQGMTLEELGEFLKEIGCSDAMNFDGGGSAAMFVDGREIVSYITKEREIVNSLLITAPPKTTAAATNSESSENPSTQN